MRWDWGCASRLRVLRQPDVRNKWRHFPLLDPQRGRVKRDPHYPIITNMAYAMTLHETGFEPVFTILGVLTLALGHKLNIEAKAPAF